MRTTCAAVQSVCSDWVERYQEDAGAATSEVVQFLFNASGCNVQMDSENFEELDVATVTAEFSNQENFPEVCALWNHQLT